MWKWKFVELDIWKQTIPVVVGAPEQLKRKVVEFVNTIPRRPHIFKVKKIALTKSAHILRKFLLKTNEIHVIICTTGNVVGVFEFLQLNGVYYKDIVIHLIFMQLQTEYKLN